MTTVTIAGKAVRALRHGMAGQPGQGARPWDEREPVHEALVSAGEEFGLAGRRRAYGSNALESGWIPSPLPAVYTGERLKAYREWLPAAGYEGSASLGGSFYSQDIEDYYFTPTSATGISSSSTTISSGVRRSRGWQMLSIARRSPWRSTTRT